ncbi:hypothetical protein T265_02178 [Opisthorchis viverrini]|uniref:Uncharacterized protein n=1 Tax=Opisthorchis viverrini TaxID=6198 RepID=A0A075A7Q9_OPIVI|nr:hypothetical protein T265_02178 [Opisthorchis viverrini]KER31675.1 hypothetical protein T265_02178 [Opisthorchis viverrini]
MEVTIEKSGSEASRKICIPVNPKQDLRQIFNWYDEHIRHENDSLLFVSIVKPQFTMPVLVGTAIKIPRTNVNRGKELCREAMRLAKKHGFRANSYTYVGTNQQKTLTQCLGELKPDLVLVEKQMKNIVLRKLTGDCQDLRQIFNWYDEHIKNENDSLLFVSIVKPQFTMPVLVGTAIEISRTNVKQAKELCREAMRLAKKHELKANSYIYIGMNQKKTLTQCLRELKPDLVLIEKQMKNIVLRKLTGDCQDRKRSVKNSVKPTDFCVHYDADLFGVELKFVGNSLKSTAPKYTSIADETLANKLSRPPIKTKTKKYVVINYNQ